MVWVTMRVLQQRNQLPAVLRRRLETKAPVERLCLGIEGMCQHRPNACMLGNSNGAMSGILQKAEAQAVSLVIEIDRQPCQNDQRDRVLAHAATNTFGCINRVDLADGEAVIASNAVIIARDKSSC